MVKPNPQTTKPETVPISLAENIFKNESKGNTALMERLKSYSDTRLCDDLCHHIPQWKLGSVEILVMEAVRRLFMRQEDRCRHE